MTEENKAEEFRFKSLAEIESKNYRYNLPGLPNATLKEVICKFRADARGGAKINEPNLGFTEEEIVEYANYLLENKLLSV